MNGIEIVSTGYAKIEKTLDNQQLEQMVETSNEWIVSRTGILKRHLSDKSSAFLAIEAAKKATQNQDLSQLALIIVATMTPENNTPSNACLVQKALGLNHQSMMCFDINVACSGYVYALKVAQSLLEENQYGLVIGSEQLSSIVDYQDRNTCILFGDGAGAVFLCFYGLCVSSWDTGAMESGTRRNVAGHAALSKRKWALLAAGAQRRGDFAFDPAAHAAVHNPYAVWRAAAPLWCAESFVAADAERGAGCACSV